MDAMRWVVLGLIVSMFVGLVYSRWEVNDAKERLEACEYDPKEAAGLVTK